MKRTLAFLLMLILLAALLPLAAGEEITYTGTVTGSSLHLRSQPSASGKVVNTYKKGTKVEILENDGTWCKVKIGSRTGYMMAQYLTIAANYPHLGWGKTPNDGTLLNLRSAADPSAQVVYKAMSGGVFELVESQGDWYRVRAGNQFGYLEKSKITPVEGDFALGLSGNEDESRVTVSQLRGAVREVGSPAAMNRAEGQFLYSVSYPVLDIPAADQAIEQWARDTIRLCEADGRQNHGGAPASLTVEYRSLQINDRYQSVLLMGEYQVGALRAETVMAVNIDAEEGRLISNRDELFGADETRALFCLESGISSLMTTPTDGYVGRPDAAWFQYAALTREGVEIYLPAGLYLPASLGTRKVALSFHQVAECMNLHDGLLAPYLRVIDPARPMIALTFDDGPSDQTDRILAVLDQYNARATFCVIGNKVETYGDVVKRTLALGNEIACHTWNHTKLTTVSSSTIRSQITRTNDAVREVTGGYEIKVLRPPYGSVNKNVRTVCGELDMVIAEWSVDTLDWDNRNTNKTYRAIMKGAQNGAIILCHDLYKTTAAAVEKAVPELVAKGYQLVTVSELLSFHKDGARPGTVYSNVDPQNMKTN